MMADLDSADAAIAFLRANIHRDQAPADFPHFERILAADKTEASLEALLQGLMHGDEYIRAASASGLGYTGNEAAVEPLINALMRDPATYVRCDAALALGRLRAEAAIPRLVECFDCDNFEVQKRIVTAVGMIGTRSSDQALRLMNTHLTDMATPPEQAEFLASEIRKRMTSPGTT